MRRKNYSSTLRRNACIVAKAAARRVPRVNEMQKTVNLGNFWMVKLRWDLEESEV